MTIVGVLPARYGATRLPGKPLADIAGRPLIQHVFDRARCALNLDRVVVATDDERIFKVVKGFGGAVVMTSPDARTGSDRVAQAAETLDAEIIVNLQGDEPLVDPLAIDATVDALRSSPHSDMATPAAFIVDPADILSPHVVKVVVDETGRALWFSRAAIPHVRLTPADPLRSAQEAIARKIARRHIGIYAFRRNALLDFARWPSSPMEIAEGLEQLRALENGQRILVVDVASAGGPAVDTPKDLEKVRELLARNETIHPKESS
ncbi:MAG: 3-deoxy-manno-octulosonate cytidylyltransferase [Actinomycetota bacterium]|nr:3-deoxy-manno-octulosonate cytidylyltransferase [Actinomycetota bacterium]